MPLEHDTTMAEDAQGRVLAQYRESPQLMDLIGQLGANVQFLEDAFWDLNNASLLASAVGVWLEYLGFIVGEFKEGWSDANFRRFIEARILANRSSGTINEVLAVLAKGFDLTSATILQSYTEYYPASALMVVDPDVITTTDLRRTVYRIVARARAAGVRLLINTAFGDATTFTCADSDDAQPVMDADQGFGDSDDLGGTGGMFASGDLA